MPEYIEPDDHLPDGPPAPGTRLLLEMYADEIAAHGSSISVITGGSAQLVDLYKQNCFKAAELLRRNAQLLRQNGFGETPPPTPVKSKSIGKLMALFAAGVGLAGAAGNLLHIW